MVIFYSVMSLLQGKGIQPSYSLKKGTDKLFIQHNLFICPLPPQTRGYHDPEESTHEKSTTQPEVGLTEEQPASYAFKKIWAGGELQPAYIIPQQIQTRNQSNLIPN
ncbi:hypothetical protein BPLS_P5483 [Bathymodiolus platifrons methanotrophic gill symbiont]|nr:hypothetical protein BPLS_P5483 [Bathymodiolus platifrons methanotrophic gill symbiont]